MRRLCAVRSTSICGWEFVDMASQDFCSLVRNFDNLHEISGHHDGLTDHFNVAVISKYVGMVEVLGVGMNH